MAASESSNAERRSMPERPCIVCLEGEYVTRFEADADGILTKEPNVTWHVEACTRCGHVQLFRYDWRGSPDVDSQ